ncbi:MAG: hypothetical protein LBP20_05925 [Treponema sp.]|jgi:hypothetical protein|nr:hypothetical protein [Treponema sp.]
MKKLDSGLLLVLEAVGGPDVRLRERFPWEKLCGAIAETFRFTARERAEFSRNATARLIGAIPFAAGCDEAERTALAHLAVYMTEIRGGSLIGAHTPADNASLLARLRLIASFKGGDRRVIDHGMNRLALIMIRGYERSRAEDARQGIYNPLNDGSWDAGVMKAKLTGAIGAFPCDMLDRMAPDDKEGEIGGW